MDCFFWTGTMDFYDQETNTNGEAAVGMEITIFNPRLDTDGKVLSAFLNLLSSAFPNTQDNCSR
jgi:hypothetical protein